VSDVDEAQQEEPSRDAERWSRPRAIAVDEPLVLTALGRAALAALRTADDGDEL
jgi:hypothetical protein